MMKYVFSTTIIIIGLLMYAGGVGSFYLTAPEQGISHFLMVVGGLTTLIGVRMLRASSNTNSGIAKALGLISFFVFIGCTLIGLVTIFNDTGVSMFVIVFSLGCAMLTALIQGLMEQPREQVT